MPNQADFLFEDYVHSEWVDYNGHMNDAEYARVFSMAVEALMNNLGIDADFRDQHQYSIYTLETHLSYLAELKNGQYFRVTVQLLDYDAKRLHVFFTMEDEKGMRVATSEQMLMGMDMAQGKPDSFPLPIEKEVKKLAKVSEGKEIPAEVGRVIGIRRRK